MRFYLVAFAVLLSANASASPMVDQAHVVTQSVGGRIVYAGNAPAQSVTAGASGLLSQVDVLLNRDAGDIGDLSLEIWPVVGAGPAGSTPLFSTPIDTSQVAVGSYDYVEVDVSSGQVFLSPGQEYAIAVNGSAGLRAPNAAWGRGFPAYDAGGRFDRAGVWGFDSPDSDYGFRTWVDSEINPSGDLVAIPLIEDAEARLYPNIGLTQYDDSQIVIDAERSDGADSRGLFTFNASQVLPVGAVIQSAQLSMQINSFTSSSGSNPIVDFYGFAAAGLPTSDDAADLSQPLGTSGPITELGVQEFALDPAEIQSLLNESNTLGVTAVQAGAPQWISVVSSETAASSPSSFSAPQLTLGLAPEPPAANLPVGDFNGDARVDAADYTVWRDGDPRGDADGDSDVDEQDRALWAAAYGAEPLEEVTNGGFESGDLSEWDVVVGPNTNVSRGFPRVESFDVNGDGASSDAMRVRLGRSDRSEFGGEVSIEQELLLEGGDYELAIDVASQSLESGGNSGPGNYLLSINGEVVSQVLLNGTTIGSLEVLRETLTATLTDLAPGYHTVRLTIARGASNSRAIYQFIDNVEITRLGGSQLAPEPGALGLVFTLMALVAAGRRES